MSNNPINNDIIFDNYYNNTVINGTLDCGTITSGTEAMRITDTGSIEIASIDNTPSLCIAEESTIRLGNDFTISVPELRACIKLIKEQAKQAYPEDFI